jgi:two-component system phosphate regulon sensor histidine kinase PhoR
MRLVEDVLQLGRIESRSEPLPARDEALLPLVESTMERFVAAAAAKAIRVDIDVPASLRAHVNADALDHALGNLLENAMKYTPARGHVAVRAREDGSRVRLDVDDDGPGIAPEHLPRLFERFYRADEGRAREAGGSGIGLALVKHLAAAMAGEVTVASAPGSGTTFSLWLPAA